MQISKIWNMTDGPFEDPEINELFSVICLVEYEDGSTGDQELYLPDVEACRTLERYFKSSIVPLTIDDVAELCYPRTDGDSDSRD